MQVGNAIGPGMETLVHVSQTKHTRLPALYGQCTSRSDMTGADLKEDDTLNTIDTCYGLCMQQVFIDSCNCYSTEHQLNEMQKTKAGAGQNCLNNSLLVPNTQLSQQVTLAVLTATKDINKNVQLLLLGVGGGVKFSEGVDKFYRRCNCLLTNRLTLADNLGSCNCRELWNEYTYDVNVFRSPWPHRDHQLAFYDKYIDAHPEIYGNKFDAYAEIQADVGNVSDAEILKLIRKHFIRVVVLFDSYSSIELEESPSMNMDNSDNNLSICFRCLQV